VRAVGLQTEMGKIGKSLRSLGPEQTLLKKEISSFVKKFAIYGFFLCFLVFLAYGLINYDWLQGLLSGKLLAMSQVWFSPERKDFVVAVHIPIAGLVILPMHIVFLLNFNAKI